MNFSRGYSYLRFAKDINLNDGNNLLNIYNNSNESLNVLMSGIINKIDVKHTGIKQETIINTNQKILSQELNLFENESKNLNNNFLQIKQYPSMKKNKRLSVIYNNALRKQSTIKNSLRKVATIKNALKKVSTIKNNNLKKVQTIKSTNNLKKISTIKSNSLKKVSTIKSNSLKKVSTIKNTLRKQSTIKKFKNSIKINKANEMKNNYLSQSSIKKNRRLSNTHLSTNNLQKKLNSNKNMKLPNDFIHRIYSVKSEPSVKFRKKMARKSVKFNEKFLRNNISKKKLTNNYTKDLFRDYTLKPKILLDQDFSSIFEKIPENQIKKKRHNSVKQILSKLYNLHYIYQNELLNRKSIYKTDIMSSKIENENYFKNNLFKKTLFEVSEIQNDIRGELYGDSSDNESRNKSKRSSQGGLSRGSSFNTTRDFIYGINPEYFRVLKRKNLVYDSLVDEGENEDNKALLIGRFYILPNSIFKNILDFLLFLCIIYDDFIHSFLFAYTNKQVFGISLIELILNLIVETIYLLDFISGFF
jgi:hypothetical protein